MRLTLILFSPTAILSFGAGRPRNDDHRKPDAQGQLIAAPPRSVMNSRRLSSNTASPPQSVRRTFRLP